VDGKEASGEEVAKGERGASPESDGRSSGVGVLDMVKM